MLVIDSDFLEVYWQSIELSVILDVFYWTIWCSFRFRKSTGLFGCLFCYTYIYLAQTKETVYKITLLLCPKWDKLNKHMKSIEFETLTIKPKTPEQQKIASLQATKKRAANALKSERDRQKANNARETLATLNR